MNNRNYYVIHGWMIRGLKLKGNSLLVFAIINGFSQDNNSKFNGSLKYLQEATNGSKNTVIKSLQEHNKIRPKQQNNNKIKYSKNVSL